MSEGHSDAGRLAALFVEHGPQLRRFLLGVLRDAELAADVMQTAFAKALEQPPEGGDQQWKSWLFKVAFNEALAAKRRAGVQQRGREKAAWKLEGFHESPEETAARNERAASVRKAVDALPLEQKRVVQLRIFEDKTFATIAAELSLPLGTVLTRMRLAMERLRRSLGSSAEM